MTYEPGRHTGVSAALALLACVLSCGCGEPVEPPEQAASPPMSNVAPSPSRVQIPDLPRPRQYHTAARLGDAIYVTGGVVGDDRDPTTSAITFDPATGQWRDIAPMRVGRLFHALAAHDGRLYAIGGYGVRDPFLASVEVYDPATDAWTALPDMPTPRNRLAAVFLDRRLLVIGGLSADAGDAIVERYDPDARKWKRLPDLSGGRHGHCAVAIAGRVFVLGGVGEGNHLPTELWDTAAATGGEWVSRASPPHVLLFFGAGAIDGDIYAVAGRGDRRLARYDVVTDEWTVFDVGVAETVNRFGCVVMGGRLVVLGGELNNGAPTAKVEIIEPPH